MNKELQQIKNCLQNMDAVKLFFLYLNVCKRIEVSFPFNRVSLTEMVEIKNFIEEMK